MWGCGGKTITWNACAAMHAKQLRQTDKTVTRCLQTDRQTWAQLCMFTCVQVILLCLNLWQRLEKWRQTENSFELSWAIVHKPECERCSIILVQIYLLGLTSIKTGTLHSSCLTVHRTEKLYQFLQKSIVPCPTVILKHITCDQSRMIQNRKASFF